METTDPRLDSSYKEFYEWWDKLFQNGKYPDGLFEEIARMAWTESKKIERKRCLEIANKHKAYGWDTWGQCSTSIANEIEEG